MKQTKSYTTELKKTFFQSKKTAVTGVRDFSPSYPQDGHGDHLGKRYSPTSYNPGPMNPLQEEFDKTASLYRQIIKKDPSSAALMKSVDNLQMKHNAGIHTLYQKLLTRVREQMSGVKNTITKKYLDSKSILVPGKVEFIPIPNSNYSQPVIQVEPDFGKLSEIQKGDIVRRHSDKGDQKQISSKVIRVDQSSGTIYLTELPEYTGIGADDLFYFISGGESGVKNYLRNQLFKANASLFQKYIEVNLQKIIPQNKWEKSISQMVKSLRKVSSNKSLPADLQNQADDIANSLESKKSSSYQELIAEFGNLDVVLDSFLSPGSPDFNKMLSEIGVVK